MRADELLGKLGHEAALINCCIQMHAFFLHETVPFFLLEIRALKLNVEPNASVTRVFF